MTTTKQLLGYSYMYLYSTVNKQDSAPIFGDVRPTLGAGSGEDTVL